MSESVPYINTETRTCKTTLELKNSDNIIKPGMTARVKMRIETAENKLLIPKGALLIRDNRELVFYR